MPRVWRLAHKSHMDNPIAFAALEDASPGDADFEDVEADELRVRGGALVFEQDGVPKYVVAADGYAFVVLLSDT